jgi:hypothetical protein
MDRRNKSELYSTYIEEAISELETVITTAKGKELRRKENLAAQVRDEEYQEKLKFDKEKLELKLYYEKKIVEEQAKKPGESGPQKPNVRLQKLEITKFDGTYKDWLRFWNQFKAEIHAADIPAVTKFTYLAQGIGRAKGENCNSRATVYNRGLREIEQETFSKQGMANQVK